MDGNCYPGKAEYPCAKRTATVLGIRFVFSCYQSTVWGYNAPDFTKVALAYGIESYSINTPDEIETGLAKLWKDSTQPFLLEVSMDIHTNVFPKMLFGKPLTELDGEDL